MTRQKLSGKNDKGAWEMFKVEVRGQDGRICSVIVNDPAGVPPKGEFVCVPVFVGNNGQLRECKQLSSLEF